MNGKMMSMSMPTSASSTADMSGMSMPSSTSSSMPMSSMSSGAMMGMDSMAMVFFSSTATPLYSLAWTPDTTGQYAATCIFLIIFAAMFRALLAARVHFYDILDAVKRRRSGGLIYPTHEMSKLGRGRPWRAGEAVMLAFVDVVLAGVSYLLMLAVMTMNVGYFLSILGGVFTGSVLFGHSMAGVAAH